MSDSGIEECRVRTDLHGLWHRGLPDFSISPAWAYSLFGATAGIIFILVTKSSWVVGFSTAMVLQDLIEGPRPSDLACIL